VFGGVNLGNYFIGLIFSAIILVIVFSFVACFGGKNTNYVTRTVGKQPAHKKASKSLI
jgi:hypothetical protein